jgi:hypothetical protein
MPGMNGNRGVMPGPPNALAAGVPQPGGQPGASPAGQPPFNVVQHTEDNWQKAQAQHKVLLQSAKRMSSVRTELDALAKLGDQVQVEDVIKGAGTLVGAGFAPAAVAQLLSTMPTTGGEALQAWIEQQDQQVQAGEAQLQQKVKASAIHRGITAMASLHVDHVKGQIQQARGAVPPQGSPPMGGALAPTPQATPTNDEENGE